MSHRPPAIQALLKVENVLHDCGLERSLIELVKMRASQINACAFCPDMYSKDARKNGESEARLYLLNAWHESPLYSPRERAAFILHDVFEVGFDEVGTALGPSGAACRQLSSRAREHLRAERPRFTVSPEDGDRFAINVMPGVITVDREGTFQSVALEIQGGVIAAIYVVRNPHKLAHIGDTSAPRDQK